MVSVRVSSKGEITIPAQMRKKLRIKPGTRILFEAKGIEIIAHPMTSVHNKACNYRLI